MKIDHEFRRYDDMGSWDCYAVVDGDMRATVRVCASTGIVEYEADPRFHSHSDMRYHAGRFILQHRQSIIDRHKRPAPAASPSSSSEEVRS